MSVLGQHLLLATAWLVYGAVHSWLASPRTKRWVRSQWPGLAIHYRAFYNTVALVLLSPLAALHFSIANVPLWAWSGLLAWIANGLTMAALLGLLWSLRYYDMREFLGMAPGTRAGLRISPIHRYVRHPWYFFGLVLLWTRDMDSAMWVTASSITVYLIIGSRLEERQLVEEYGPAYQHYRNRVPGLIPLPGRHIDAATAQAIERDAARRSDTA